jgi:mobilization protein NikA
MTPVNSAALKLIAARMARPKKTPDDLRTDTLGIRLTAIERARLDEFAALHGLTATEFMRRRSLGYRLPAPIAEQRQLAALATALLRIGVNLNQLTHHVNAGSLPPADLLPGLLSRINALLDTVYDPRADGAGPQL